MPGLKSAKCCTGIRCCPGNRGCRCGCGCAGSEWVHVLLLVAGCAVGVTAGVTIRIYFPDKDGENAWHIQNLVEVISLPAVAFRQLVSLLCLPLIVFSVVSSLGSVKACYGAKLVGLTASYFLLTTGLATIQGIAFVYATQSAQPSALNLSQPKVYLPRENPPRSRPLKYFHETLLLGIVPETSVELNHYLNLTLADDIELVHSVHGALGGYFSLNYIGLVFYSLIFGFGLSRFGKDGELVQSLLEALFSLQLKIMLAFSWFYPVFVACSFAVLIIKLDQHFIELLYQLALHHVTVLLGLFCHVVFVLPALHVVLTRRNPYALVLSCGRALLTSLFTNDRLMTIPAIAQNLKRSRTHDAVLRVVVPLGAVLNSDSTALSTAADSVFLAKFCGVNPGPWHLILISLTSVATSIGGLLGLPFNTFLWLQVYSFLGLQPSHIFLMYSLTWARSHVLSAVNTWSDCVGADILNNCLARKPYTPSPPDSLDFHERRRTESLMECKEEFAHTSIEQDMNSGNDEQDGLISTHIDDDIPGSRGQNERVKPVRRVLKSNIPGSNDWTVRLENEEGAKLFVSKV